MLASECQIQGWINGTPDIVPTMVTDALLPGRALTKDGNGIEVGTKMRAYGVANLFLENNLLSRGGIIVPSANRTPPADEGDEWCDPETGEVFPRGIPEAEGYRRTLVDECGVPAENVVKQQHSCESVGDIWFGQAVLLDKLKARRIEPAKRVVLIAAQEEHLESIMEDIAPSVMRMRYIGAVIPEEDPDNPDSFSPTVRPIRRLVAYRLDRHSPEVVGHKIDKRAKFFWTLAMSYDKLRGGRSAIGSASVETSFPG